ncbi:hypothetical protein FLGE108171_09105 [Flavobacterium gelidilacus]|uniref:hypothetical protein n=1 Tax=Flavobacterium gelidilacus TaxID=206041 RepID=UPI00041BEAF1|nr:hypothetical protein [Flavobacterium gelidilacus]
MKRIIVYPVLALIVVLFSITTSCSSNDCEYVTIIDPCGTTNILNLSTGIDESGNVIAPGTGVIDPYWRLINRPLFKQSTVSATDQQLVNTINGNAFLVDNNDSSNTTNWINQENSSPICALNAGTTQSFNAVTVRDNIDYTPYVFERSFCVKQPTNLIINFTARGNLQVYFKLINNSTNITYSTSQSATANLMSWNETVNVLPGNYSIRAYLIYKGSTLPAFSLVGNIKTTDNSFVLSNNKNNCCANNVINLMLIEDNSCDGFFDSNIDNVLSNNFTTVSLFDTSGNLILTQQIEGFEDVFFAGLPDGTYTINLSTLPSAASISPNNFQVTVSNNEVKNFNIFVCP